MSSVDNALTPEQRAQAIEKRLLEMVGAQQLSMDVYDEIQFLLRHRSHPDAARIDSLQMEVGQLRKEKEQLEEDVITLGLFMDDLGEIFTSLGLAPKKTDKEPNMMEMAAMGAKFMGNLPSIIEALKTLMTPAMQATLKGLLDKYGDQVKARKDAQIVHQLQQLPDARR